MNRFLKPASARRAVYSLPALALLAGLTIANAQTPAATSGKRRNRNSPPAPQTATAPAAAPDPQTAAMIDASSAERGISPGGTPPPPASTETEILASQGATFASKDRIAVFTGDVRVRDPKFQLAADKLTVYLAKASEKAAPGSTPATPPPLAGASPAASPAEKSGGGGIDHAKAEGHVVIIQERPAQPGSEPKRSVGRADEADFDSKTGDMVLRGNPSVEQNGNSHVATDPSTVMTLRRDNSLDTKGPSRTLITQRKGNSDMFGTTPVSTPATR